jgi:hypothetical protein
MDDALVIPCDLPFATAPNAADYRVNKFSIANLSLLGG